MKTITVKASKTYEVRVGEGLLQTVGTLAAEVVRGKTVAVVSDSNIFPLYGKTVCDSLAQADFRVESFVFSAGEESKNLSTYGELLHFLSEKQLTREDAVLTLGGGVVGDLGGFAAATYLRGVGLVAVPTSLLAMVDSSVGGKTAVDLDIGKNQVGCFYQPLRVICDPQTLKTLPDEQFACGSAEVIKYGLMANAPFFDALAERPMGEWIEEVIATCVEMKRDVVEQDEFEQGLRALLNLGHTVGHAVETCSGYSVLHGQAVAIGMAVLTRAAAEKGLCDTSVAERLEEILKKYDLPTKTQFSAEELIAVIRNDKKRKQDAIECILPREIGVCEMRKIALEELADWLSAGGVQ